MRVKGTPTATPMLLAHPLPSALAAPGEPHARLVAILGGVALLSTLATLVFRSAIARRGFGLD